MKTFAIASLLSMLLAPAAISQTSHGMDHSNMPMGTDQMDGAVHAEATVNSCFQCFNNVCMMSSIGCSNHNQIRILICNHVFKIGV